MIFISNSDYSKRVFYHEVCDEPDIQTLYNPISHKKFVFDERHRFSEKPYRVIYAGRLSKGKNLDLWLNIAFMMEAIFPGKFVFEIHGQGELSGYMRHKIKEHKAQSYIFLKGYSKNVTRVYQEADLLLFLSGYESFGNVVVESILCGTPVIASDIPSMREIFCNYPDFLVALDDNVKQNVLNKIENIDKLQQILPAVRNEFVTRFSEEQHLGKLTNIYSSKSTV